jgi:thiamine-phosphate pyrophosphorylase
LCLPKPAPPTTSYSRMNSGPLLLYYITDRRQFRGSSADQIQQLLARITECAAAGVDYIQLREKDLSARELGKLAVKAFAALPGNSPSKLLINSRLDVALACGAHGVHLPAGDLNPGEARALWSRASERACVIGVSTHSAREIALAESHGADFAVFGPVFEKAVFEKAVFEKAVFEKAGATNPGGLQQLQQVCQRSQAAVPPMPVLALGGVTVQNAPQCLGAGCQGIAGIRLFQEMNAFTVVRTLREQFAKTRNC